jgi:hypothetical protein
MVIVKDINFTAKYEDGTRWTMVLSDFLAYLSQEYGYTIDEYNLMYSNWSMKVDRLCPLVDKRNKVAANLLSYYADGEIKQRKQAEEMRKEAKETFEALIKGLANGTE